jgi:hypothetical protein
MSESSPEKQSWASLFFSTAATARLAAFFLAALPLAAYLASFAIARFGPVRLEQTKEGNVVINLGAERLTVVSVPANQLWFDTGFDVEKNYKVHISAFGSVHLAVGQLSHAALHHFRARLGWVNPCGERGETTAAIRNGCREEINLRSRQQRSRLLRVDSSSNPGALIGCLYTGGKLPGLENPRPSGVFLVGNSADLSDKTGRLYLTVNDIVITSVRDRDAFLPKPEELLSEDLDTRKYDPTWRSRKPDEYITFSNTIIAKHWWDAEFDDNIGAFSVSIKMYK